MRRSSIIFSAAFHLAVFICAITGLPFLTKRELVIPPPIVVEFVEISKVTQTNKVAPQPVPAPEKEEPKPEEPPPPPKNTTSEAAVPVPEKPKPEEQKEPPKKEIKPETVDKDAPPDKKKPPKKVEQAKKEPQKDFSSVLKNLADPKEKTAAKDTPDLKLNEKTTPTAGQNAPLGEKMTMSEEDALRAQLEKCWNVPFGAKDAENLAVDIFMVINQDRTLREARIVDTARYNSDTFFRAAADSALRAVRSPLCSPFDVPPDKYDTWNTVTVTFNPKDMF